jgi:hypothetical protein
VHDVVELEDRGVPAVALHTHSFMNSAVTHARAYGRSDLHSLSVPAPIANVSREAVRTKAANVLDGVIAVLTGTYVGSGVAKTEN